jgi:hypothetical protein
MILAVARRSVIVPVSNICLLLLLVQLTELRRDCPRSSFFLLWNARRG